MTGAPSAAGWSACRRRHDEGAVLGPRDQQRRRLYSLVIIDARTARRVALGCPRAFQGIHNFTARANSQVLAEARSRGGPSMMPGVELGQIISNKDDLARVLTQRFRPLIPSTLVTCLVAAGLAEYHTDASGSHSQARSTLRDPDDAAIAAFLLAFDEESRRNLPVAV